MIDTQDTLFPAEDAAGQFCLDDESLCRLFELSANAHDAAVHAWMSGLPITAEIVRFCRKALAAAERAGRNLRGGARQEAERRAAETAAADRGDPGIQTVLEAAYKARREIDRLRGLLRFSPNAEGVYIARCEPDHFVLPALGEYFERRFGDTAWAIIDEKRGLVLSRTDKTPPVIRKLDRSVCPAFFSEKKAESGGWESLWKHYHKTINIENRKNPRVQRQCMPERYWKYLPEMESDQSEDAETASV